MVTLHTSHFQVNSATCTSDTENLVFIDMAVEDYSNLANGVLDHTQVFTLESTQNGVEQITEILASCVDAQRLVVGHRSNLINIHIVSHGAPGCLQLGNTNLGLDTLDEYSQHLQQWQQIFLASAKSDRAYNLLIYGCNVAAGDAGEEFVAKLHQLTGANIAASRQRIGNAALGGNWELEVRTTDMEVSLAFSEATRQAYAGILATFTVNDTGDADDGDPNNNITTLREAINLANATTGEDTITFGGVFDDTTPDVITLTSGQLTINGNVTILGTGASHLTVSGNNASRVFEISGVGTDAIVDGLTIANGNDGGILIDNNTILSLNNSTVSKNKGSVGGILNRGSLSLTNSTVSGNTGSSLGGGIHNTGNLSLTNSNVSGNNATIKYSNAYGGGIFNTGTLSLTNSTVSNNSLYASGFERYSPDPYPTYGGGIYNSGSVSLTNSTVSDSRAQTGSGIYNSGTFSLTNSTVSGNRAYSSGGGIYNSGSITLASSTITSNIASDFYVGDADGGGIVNLSDGTVIVENTIIAGNFDTPDTYGQEGFYSNDVWGNFIDSGNNLIGDRTGSTGFTTSTLVGTSVNPINPKLSPLQNNGGTTLTHALLADSPAINAGANSSVPAGVENDQRGAGFNRISEGTVDIGALEFNGIKGTNGADNLVGKNYADIINAQPGNDTITGNQGNDILTGGGGNDKFVYNLGDGIDIITYFGGVGKGSNPSAAIIAKIDTLQFQGAGLTARNLLLTQNANNLEVTFEGVANNKVILQDFALENLENLSSIGNILFDSQTTISDRFDVFNADSTQSTIFNKNTVTFLNDLNNNIDGFDNSADVINGQEGHDRIDGKSGNDLLRGGAGNDTLIGGAGNDTLIDSAGNNTLIGGDGDDILTGGALGNTLTGGSGHDQFVYQALSNGDTISDFNQSEDKLILTDLFKSRGYSSSNPISDGYLRFVQSDTSTQVQFAYYGISGNFYTFATLDNFIATNLVVGTNVIV